MQVLNGTQRKTLVVVGLAAERYSYCFSLLKLAQTFQTKTTTLTGSGRSCGRGIWIEYKDAPQLLWTKDGSCRIAAFLTRGVNSEGVFTGRGEVNKRKEEIGITGDDVGVLEGRGGGGEV